MNVQSIELSLVDLEFKKYLESNQLVAILMQRGLNALDAMALTEKTARKLFGNTDVVGKSVLINGKTYTITALLSNPLEQLLLHRISAQVVR